MKKTETLQSLENKYARLREELGQVGYLSKGSVVQRAPGKPGSRYQWTTKVKNKTVSLSLSEEQYEWLKQAVGNQRQTERILKDMHQLSRKIMRLKFPDTHRRKTLNPSVLRLI
jgi:hypothetical protein